MPDYLCRKCGLIRVPESETATTRGLRFHARCGYMVKEADHPSVLTDEERKAVLAALDEQASFLQMGIRAYDPGRANPIPPDAPISKADLEKQLAVVESARAKVLGHADTLRTLHAAGVRAGQERGQAQIAAWLERSNEAELAVLVRALPLRALPLEEH